MSKFNPTIEKNKLVAFHWNSHRDCYSILEMKSKRTVGKLLGYAASITVSNCYFVFQESKRNYTLESKKKERHSFVVGNFESLDVLIPTEEKVLYYNPHVSLNFLDATDYFKEKDFTVIKECGKISATSTDKFGGVLKPHLLYEN